MKLSRTKLRKIILEEISLLKESQMDDLTALVYFAGPVATGRATKNQTNMFKAAMLGLKEDDPEKFNKAMENKVIKKAAEKVGIK